MDNSVSNPEPGTSRKTDERREKPSEREDNQNQSDKTKTNDSSIDNLTKVVAQLADNLSSVAQKVNSMTETVGSKQKGKPSTTLPDDRVDDEDEVSEKSFKSKNDVSFHFCAAGEFN